MTRTERATALVEEMARQGLISYGISQSTCIDTLLTAFAAEVERETWERAANIVERDEGCDDHIWYQGNVRYQRVNEILKRRAWEIRAQAQAVASAEETK